MTEDTQIVEDPLDNEEVNMAAYNFSKLIPAIKDEISDLSLRGIQRLLMTVVEYPFVTNKMKLTKKEQNIFMNIVTALHCKDKMMTALSLSKPEMDKKVIDPIINELQKEN